MARYKKEIMPTIPKKKCVHCGTELEYKDFYQLHNNSNIYAGNDNYFPVCKECLKILYEQYRIRYVDQFSILGTEPEDNEIEKLTIKRLCMAFDIYYSDRLFDGALKQIERFPTLDMATAYMRIANLKQSKGKSYDDTIIEENMSQELVKSAIADKVRRRFEDDGLYQNIYDLCLKLIQSLKKNCDVDFQNDYR